MVAAEENASLISLPSVAEDKTVAPTLVHQTLDSLACELVLVFASSSPRDAAPLRAPAGWTFRSQHFHFVFAVRAIGGDSQGGRRYKLVTAAVAICGDTICSGGLTP